MSNKKKGLVEFHAMWPPSYEFSVCDSVCFARQNMFTIANCSNFDPALISTPFHYIRSFLEIENPKQWSHHVISVVKTPKTPVQITLWERKGCFIIQSKSHSFTLTAPKWNNVFLSQELSIIKDILRHPSGTSITY